MPGGHAGAALGTYYPDHQLLRALGINAVNPAKAAVHVWAKGLSRVVGRDGPTVNGLAPGRIHREPIDQHLHPTAESRRAFAAQIPLGSFGEPEAMALGRRA